MSGTSSSGSVAAGPAPGAGSRPRSPGMARMVAPGTDIWPGDTAGYHPVRREFSLTEGAARGTRGRLGTSRPRSTWVGGGHHGARTWAAAGDPGEDDALKPDDAVSLAAMGLHVPEVRTGSRGGPANAGRVPLTDTRPGMIDIFSRRLLYEPALPALTRGAVDPVRSFSNVKEMPTCPRSRGAAQTGGLSCPSPTSCAFGITARVRNGSTTSLPSTGTREMPGLNGTCWARSAATATNSAGSWMPSTCWLTA